MVNGMVVHPLVAVSGCVNRCVGVSGCVCLHGVLVVFVCFCEIIFKHGNRLGGSGLSSCSRLFSRYSRGEQKVSFGWL